MRNTNKSDKTEIREKREEGQLQREEGQLQREEGQLQGFYQNFTVYFLLSYDSKE